MMAFCDNLISSTNNAICMNLEKCDILERGFISVNILSQLRNLVDAINVRLYLTYGGKQSDASKYYDLIVTGRQFVCSQGQFRVIKQFYDLLQISASHYTLDFENSERLMLKYYVYLWQIRKIANEKLNIQILNNLEKFPRNTDTLLNQYYKAISESFSNLNLANAQTSEQSFYVYNIKPVVIDNSVIYELTLSLANERASKFDHIIAFSKNELVPYYASRVRITTVEIRVMGMEIPITIVIDWMPSIRLCEIKNFGKIFGMKVPESRNKKYQNLMSYLKESLFSLTEVICADEEYFNYVISYIQRGSKSRSITNILIECRSIVMAKKDGHNVLRYLLYKLNNKIIRDQYFGERCKRLSDLYLTIKSKPFDELPFSFSLYNHNPKVADLIGAISPDGHKPEFLARHLIVNAEQNGTLYTPVKELDRFGNVQSLANDYNRRLYYKHSHASIELWKKHAYIRDYDSNVHEILMRIKSLTDRRIDNYRTLAKTWMNSPGIDIDSQEKRNALENIFSNSRVAFVYGAAGTGKSTFINYISQIFSGNDKVYLANTNPAVENLRRKVSAANSSFMTISSYLARRTAMCDVLFIDECSTVCNGDMLSILNKRMFKLLVLVGDMYQIEAIRYGNWFSVSNSYFKGDYKIELTQPYRTSNAELLSFWTKVRLLSTDILEHIARNNYSSNLNETVFTKYDDDEIILCLNYGGLYGINNINRILQRNNPSKPVQWGVHIFKIGDPVLFNECDRFAPFLHNNLKGVILDIVKDDKRIYFTVSVDKIISSFDLEDSEIVYISQTDDGNGTIVRFYVDEQDDNDNDIDSSDCIVPFQIAYAVSIHKAQGLEYQSVKIIITRDVEDLITHNIFYTAITRSKNKLKIYWSPETEKNILENMKPQFNVRDYGILKSKYKDL